MWELLNDIKSAIATIPEVKSVKIGAEMGISAKDCPAVRIITEYTERSKNVYYDNGGMQILLLLDLKNDLESVYQQSIHLEGAVRAKVEDYVKFTRTDYDQDSVTSFKATVMRFSIANLRNGRESCR